MVVERGEGWVSKEKQQQQQQQQLIDNRVTSNDALACRMRAFKGWVKMQKTKKKGVGPQLTRRNEGLLVGIGIVV